MTRIRDHRRLYLDYEGEITGGRGYVTRVAGGDCEVVVAEAGVWTIQLRTGTAPGTLTFTPLGDERWELDRVVTPLSHQRG